MTQSVKAPIAVAVKSLEQLHELSFLMAAWHCTLIQVSSDHIRRHVCQLEAADFGAGPEEWDVDHVRHLTKRMAVLAEPAE